MTNWFDTEHIGKADVVSSFSRCGSCRRLILLNSYTTTRFATLFNTPCIPLARYRVLDECSACGQRSIISARKYAKDRERNLDLMMEGFASKAGIPETCCHALRTLMVYDQSVWFDDIHKTYGVRFETNAQVQHLIAQGLCRFGEFQHAIIHCRKAIVLGAGKPAEELLAFCHTLMEASPGKTELEKRRIQPESDRMAYIPLALVAAALTIFLMASCISSFRTHRAWLVNGSLRPYSIMLDGKTYDLAPGNRQQIKLKLGSHELKAESMPLRHFTYTTPLIKQLFQKNLLIINPDAMAFITVKNNTGSDEKTTYVHGRQIHILPGVSYPLFGFSKRANTEDTGDDISLFRPDTHIEMVARLKEHGKDHAAQTYARHALSINPSSSETAALLETAVHDTEFEEAKRFLQQGLTHTPILLEWHTYYQNLVIREHPGENTLVREYRDLCKDHPDHPEFYYLLGRVMSNRDDAHQFFEHSEKGRGMGGLGFHAIARELFSRADFKKAIVFSEYALERSPTNSAFLNLHEQLLFALRQYDALLTRNRKSGSTAAQTEKMVLYLTCAGYHREAEAMAERSSEELGVSASKLNSIRFYAVGNMNGYLTCLADAEDPRSAFQSSIYQNQISDADRCLSNDENHEWREHLVLFCAAMNLGEDEIAQRHMVKAIEEIGDDTFEQTDMTRLLSDTAKPSVESIKKLDINAADKALLCVSLGFRFPADRESLNALSRTYNFNPIYPQLIIKQWSMPKKTRKPLKPAA